MHNKRKDIVILDKHLTRLESPPKDSRQNYKYSITNNKQVAPKLKCCPICGELENITTRYESWSVDFHCNKCDFNGSVDYLWIEEWEPDVKGEKVVF